MDLDADPELLGQERTLEEVVGARGETLSGSGPGAAW
jgi:hypothetical protein